MIVSPESFDPSITPEEVYQLINTLPFGYLALAKESHYWGQMFGVVTGERNEQDRDQFVVNQCLRDSVWKTLRTVTDEAENFSGFNLSRRYHRVKTAWNFGGIYQVRPGVELVSKIPSWRALTGYDAVSIDPFLLHDIVVTLVGSRYVAKVPTSVVDNPNDVILRRPTDYGTFSPDPNYRPSRVGSNWEITLDNTPVPYTVADQVDVQSVKYVYIDIVNPTLLDGETAYPVFPGTNQIIPQAKSPQVLDATHTRYWFYIYTLVNPEFYNNPVNLVNAEYYKLLEFIEFKAYSEVDDFAILTIDCTCDTCAGTIRKYRVNVDIISKPYGTLSCCVTGQYFDDDGDGIFERFEEGTSNCLDVRAGRGCGYELEFSYITNPTHLDETLRTAISQALRAIMFRTAAELPMEDCGCWMRIDQQADTRTGFIARQQESFGKTSVNPLTGIQSVTFQYGELRGQKAYAELMSKIPRHKFVLL